jgi:hypothetical protein
MPSSLAPLDPEILKDQLPADIQGIVDQMTANVNQAVSDLVKRFRDNADEVAARFGKADFSGEMKATIDSEIGKLNVALSGVQTTVANLNANATSLAAAASKLSPAALTAEIATLMTANAAATKALTDFQNHVNTLAGNLGGAIASSAVKLISGA